MYLKQLKTSMKSNLSVVLATFNEEKNIKACIESVQDVAQEVIIVDGSSTDMTREIASNLGATVIKTTNPPIFHINKQRALEVASGKWVLQLDADERVSPELREEIKKVIQMSDSQIEKYQENLGKRKLFLRHQKIVEARDGKIGKDTGEYDAFFIPRL